MSAGSSSADQRVEPQIDLPVPLAGEADAARAPVHSNADHLGLSRSELDLVYYKTSVLQNILRPRQLLVHAAGVSAQHNQVVHIGKVQWRRPCLRRRLSVVETSVLTKSSAGQKHLMAPLSRPQGPGEAHRQAAEARVNGVAGSDPLAIHLVDTRSPGAKCRQTEVLAHLARDPQRVEVVLEVERAHVQGLAICDAQPR